MDIQSIVEQLKEELGRIDNAIAALTGFGSASTTRRGPGRPAGSKNPQKRTMSAAARKRISAAMKARWAAWKKAKSPAKPAKAKAKKTARRPMSQAARKKLSALMKARWAALKKQA